MRFEVAIQERNKGSFVGKPYSEGHKYIEEMGQKAYEVRWPGGGESAVDVQKRISKFVEELKHEHKGETVAIVSHGVAIASYVISL